MLLIAASSPQVYGQATTVDVDLSQYTDDCTAPAHWWDTIECKFEDILNKIEAKFDNFETKLSLFTGNLTRQVDLVFDDNVYKLESCSLIAGLGASINLIVDEGKQHSHDEIRVSNSL